MGAEVETFEDGMAITGPTKLTGMLIEARGDHRIAMAFAVAGLIAEGATIIHGAEAIATSYPDFEKDLMGLCIV
jgi:3-phosphoshikimate 1-carboxyvinyltransferase